MNIYHHPLTNIFSIKTALPLTIVAVVSLFTAVPGFSQGAGGGIPPIATNADSKFSDTNPNTVYNVRENYHKRFPFAKLAKEKDDLEKISLPPPGPGQPILPGDPGSGSTGGAGEKNGPKQTGGQTQQQKNATQTGANDTSQDAVKKSKLDETPTPVIAYNIVYNEMPYIQPLLIALDKPKTDRDTELFSNTLTTFGYPCSDTQYQIIDRENKQRMLELAYDPERITWAITTLEQLCHQSGGNALAGSSEAAFKQALTRITKADTPGNGAAGGGGGGAQVGALINIANEQSGVPTAANNPHKEVAQAVWMVQQMYRWVFVPMAILFLLPGAVITQVKSQIVQGFRLNAEDQSSPFEGILRSVIALFLIPATQLIVSYSIDVGNSMAYSVKDWVDIDQIIDWSRQLTYNTPIQQGPNQPDNAILTAKKGTNSTGGIADLFTQQGANGLGGDRLEKASVAERQDWASSTMETVFNMATYLFSSFVIVLGAYQLVFMCYLFLLGPLAAAFFAWPKVQANTAQNLFKDVFGNWVNAVIVVSLWRFYWMVILAIMTQRILYLQDNHMPSDLQWEVAVFTCLLGLMLYVPFNPWSFDPGAAYTAASSSGSSMMKGISGAMGGAAVAGGASPQSVAAIQGQVNQAIAPLAAQGALLSGLDAASTAGAPGMASTSGMGAGTAATRAALFAPTAEGQGQGQGQGQGTPVAPPPSASPAPSASTPPAAQPPVTTASAAAPPSANQPGSQPQGGSAAQTAVAQAAPGANVTPMSSSTVPLAPSNNANVAVNANANPSATAAAAPQMLASYTGGNGAAPPTSSGAPGPGSSGQQSTPPSPVLAAAVAPASQPSSSSEPKNDSQVASNSSPPGGNQGPGNNQGPPSQNA